ncbi:MAG TPA: hypothetical protein VKB45_13765, partial [Gemmatimonadales bacterium]|nr:hypothetical protein [Gemmatimonadales bacterium]
AVRAAGFSGAVQTFRRPDLEGRYAVPRVGLDRAASADRDGRLAVGMLRYSLAAISRQRLRTLLSAAPATGR